MKNMDQEKEIIEENEYKLLGYWKAPKIFQYLNNSYVYTFLYCLYAAVTSCMISGITIVNSGDVETRFDLTKSDAAFITSGVNIAFCVLVIFVSYFGERWNKAKAISVSSGIFALGAFLYTMPHYTTGRYEIAPDRFQIKCEPEWKPDCEVKEELRYAMYIMFVGHLLMGASTTTFFTLGFTYLDQSVPQRSVGFYFSQIYVFINIGATAGILGTIPLLQDIYVDFDITSAPSDIESWDSRWVGAWWLFPLICMAVSLILMAIFLGYPKHLKGASKHYNRRSFEMHDFGKSAELMKELTPNLKGLGRGLSYLILNPTYMLLTMTGIVHGMIFIGASGFLPKFFEQGLNMTAEDSGYIFGFLTALGAILGSAFGGLIVYVFKLTTEGIIKLCGFAMLLVAVLSPGFLMHCGNIPLAGVTVNYGYQNDFTPPVNPNLTSLCNEHCLCQEESYIPVCGSDNITYFSPCHAGCPVVVAPYTYGRCSCVQDNLPGGALAGFTTTVDSCGEECHYKYYTLAVSLCMIFSLGLMFATLLVATLRLVPNQLKSLSLGFQIFLIRCLGTIPGSELYGAVLAPACLMWKKDMCSGKQGICNVYDSAGMANGLMLLNLYGSLLAFGFATLAIYFYKPVNNPRSFYKTKKEETSISCSFGESTSQSFTDDQSTSEASSVTRF